MKKNMVKTSLMIAVFCFSMAISIPGQANAGWLASYYKTNPMTADQLKASYGEPVNVIKMDDGAEKMIFGPKDPEIGYTYFLTRNGRVIDRGTTDDTGSKKASGIKNNPEPRGLMADYYNANPLTVDELKARWGNPVSNHDYDNGIKKLTFGPKDPEIGYTYFLIKDGMVVDKNITGSN
ncbi:MAG: hypothetical protein GXP56_07660 [Deltaproteobacteria bacterium]|nr:hypothetical protein [Deltaproteobacteria bacterium]